MSYGTILVHTNASARSDERVQLAAAIAREHGAHLVGVAPTGLAEIRPEWGGAEVGYYYAEIQRRQRERATEVAARFDAQVRALGVDAFEHRIAEDEDAYAIALQARYADLVVIGQADPSDPTIGTVPNFVEQVLVDSGRPVLIVPSAGHYGATGRNVLLAWSASRESARAVVDALPFLRKAKLVRVVIVDGTPTPEGHGAEPGADIAVYLARHGVTVEVSREPGTGDVAGTLLSRACDYGSDLLVMGGYGHSRFREMLLGGVTRSILDSMTLPVLMSH